MKKRLLLQILLSSFDNACKAMLNHWVPVTFGSKQLVYVTYSHLGVFIGLQYMASTSMPLVIKKECYNADKKKSHKTT